MKKTVEMSTFCLILTIATSVLLVAALVYLLMTNGALAAIITVGAALLIYIIASLIYSPVSISADEESLKVNRVIKKKMIPYSEIENLALYSPTMAEKRLCGSGGVFGYWGWFSEPVIGRYFAYYGKASDCFLVRLKDGSQYLLGCKNPEEIVTYIRRHTGK